jgi:hypothetical protein
MVSMAPTIPAVGDQATAAWADEVAGDIISLAGEASPAPLSFTPGSNTDTAAGTNTWITLGNVTVPTWATKCNVVYTFNGIFDRGTTGNVTAVLKVGSASAALTKRLPGPGVANQRFTVVITDRLTGLTSGSQSVTIQTVQTTGTYRADGVSFFTALFTFQP